MKELLNAANSQILITQPVERADYEALKVSKEDFEKVIATELYRQVADIIVSKFKFEMIPLENGNFSVVGDGYFFDSKQFYALIAEICELSQEDREELLAFAKSNSTT